VGAFLWRLLAGRSRTLAELVEAVSAEYGQEPEVVAEDVRNLLDELKTEDLIVEE